jgi:hypothetical protein
MPGLVRGMVRTAAVVGTATATRNAVDRRQANKNAQAYANAQASVAPPPQQVVYAAPPPQQVVYEQAPQEYVPEAPPPTTDDMITQLERIGALKAQGILTEEEFQAQKAKILAAG